MMRTRWVQVLAGIAVLWAAASVRTGAKTDITIEFDKTFSFAGLRTWAWTPDRPGSIHIALSSDSDPKAIAAQVDPIIIPSIEKELKGRGFTRTDGTADLRVHYYLLAAINQQSQYMGQFIAPLPAWGLPPFAPVTTALETFAVGTLIIDVTVPGRSDIVWRGAAQRRLDPEEPEKERHAHIEKAVRDLFAKFPPKKK